MNAFINKQKTNTKRGFTLIEVIIAVGIFAVASVIITGVFLSLNTIQKNVRNKQVVLNDLRFAVDLIGQEISSGSAFPDCSSGCDSIIINQCKSGCQSFRFMTKIRPDIPLRRVEYGVDPATQKIMRGEQKTFGPCTVLPLPAVCYEPLTSERLKIDKLTFFVNHKASNEQPIITIVAQGTAGNQTKAENQFKISSSFAPRLLQDPNATLPSDNQPPIIQITTPTTADTYTTSLNNIVLGGTASDNVGVTEVRWRNQTIGTNGIASPLFPGYSTWTTPSIGLVTGTNVLVAEARDAEGNVSTDTLNVVSTAPLGTPVLFGGSICANTPKITLTWDAIAGASDYHIYKCTGTCIPTAELSSTIFPFYNDTNVTAGTDYSYRIRAHNHSSGQFSAYSNTVTITARGSCAQSVGSGVGGVLPGGGGGGGGPSPTFSLKASPNYVTVGVSGSSTTLRESSASKVIVVPANGFSSTVSFSASGGPSGIARKFNPTSLSSSAYSSGSFFTVTVPDNTPLGTYTLIVRGSGGGLSNAVTVTLDVYAVGGGQL